MARLSVMPRKVKDDGRTTRWEHHREERRAELVLAAVRAIDAHGPSAGIAEIAAEAGVSKPVLYRYFADKDELHAAVGQWGATEVLTRILPAVRADLPVRERVARSVDGYLRTLEEHPQVFLLLVQHRVSSTADPLADGKAAVAATISRVMADAMLAQGIDSGGAEPWAAGVVGLGLATGEWWLERRTMSREAVSRYLADFIWGAMLGITRQHGVPLVAESR